MTPPAVSVFVIQSPRSQSVTRSSFSPRRRKTKQWTVWEPWKQPRLPRNPNEPRSGSTETTRLLSNSRWCHSKVTRLNPRTGWCCCLATVNFTAHRTLLKTFLICTIIKKRLQTMNIVFGVSVFCIIKIWFSAAYHLKDYDTSTPKVIPIPIVLHLKPF